MLVFGTNATYVHRCLPLGLCILNFGHPCSFLLDHLRAKKTQVKEVTTHLVHLAGAVSLQDGDLVGELLAEWAVSSPHARRQFAVAVRLAQPSCVREVQQQAITKYASEVLPPDECCELILNLRQHGAPFLRWIPSRG